MTEIQKWLEKQGKSPTGLPLFRLVWSESQQEWRTGTFREYVNDIFIRETVGTKLVPKYPYIKNRWILEMHFPAELAFSGEIPNSREGSYEPIFVFQDKFGNELPVIRPAVEYIVNFALNGPRKRSTESGPEDQAENEAREARELVEFEDKIDSTAISSLLHTREAVTVL